VTDFAGAAAPVSLPARAALALALVLGAAFAGLHLAFGRFDADELQHAHIAWLVSQGAVPYRDFWEHHGPLFGLANGGLLALAGAAPGVELLFACRGGSALATVLVAAFTWLAARALGLSHATGATAAAFLLSVFFVQDKGVECRPDGWQNAFWAAGAWLLLLALRARRPLVLGAAGALMGLAVLANAKAALGPLAVLLWYALGRRWHGLAPRTALADLGLLAAGGLAPCALVVAWFAAHGAAGVLLHYAVAWNLEAVGYVAATSDRGWQFAASFLKRALPFALAAAAGLALWLRDLRAPAGTLARPGASLVPVLALTACAGLALGLYSQLFLFLLPPWALLAAFGVTAGAAELARRAPRAAPLALGAFVAVALANMAWQSARFAPFAPEPRLREQAALTARLLGATLRTEPVGVLWDDCAGFMFNAPLQFWWAAEPSVGAVAAATTGTDPFGAPFVAALEAAGTRYVVGTQAALAPLPAATRDYLQAGYDYSPCLWTRRGAPVP
jgi:hypothetical protein